MVNTMERLFNARQIGQHTTSAILLALFLGLPVLISSCDSILKVSVVTFKSRTSDITNLDKNSSTAGTPSSAVTGSSKATTASATSSVSSSPAIIGAPTSHLFYVDNAGNNLADGKTPATAWQTLTRVNQAASLATFVPGDQILLTSGQTFNGPLNISNFLGTGIAPLSITSTGKLPATIVIPMTDTSDNAINIGDSAGIAISNLLIVGNPNNENSGIFLYSDTAVGTNYTYFRFANLDISGFGGDGFVIASWNGDRISDVDFGASTLSNLDDGVYASGANNSTGYNFANINIHNNMISGMGSGGIYLSQVNGARVEYNTIHDGGGTGGLNGISSYHSTNLLIQYNETYNQITTANFGGYGMDLDIGTINSIAQYNYTHDNLNAGIIIIGSAGASNFNNVIRYNIAVNNQQGGGGGEIDVGFPGQNDITNLQIYNNTLITMAPNTSFGSGPIVTWSIQSGEYSNLLIANNILYTANAVNPANFLISIGYPDPSITLVGNDYYADGSFVAWISGYSYSSFPDYLAAGYSYETLNSVNVGLNVDPMLASPTDFGPLNNPTALATLTNYQLLSGSPMVGAGINLATYYSITAIPFDFFKQALPANGPADIGACH